MTKRRQSPLPEANKMARSIRNGSTAGDLAVRYGINSHVIIKILTSTGYDPSTGVWVGGDRPRPPALTTLGAGPGQTRHHVGGGDNPSVVPTSTRPFTQRQHPTGLAWPERPPMEPPAYVPKHRKPGPARQRTSKPPRVKVYDSSRGIPGGKLTADERDAICERYVEKKESSVELAREYGINDRTVRKLLRRRGVEVRSRSEALRLRHAERRARAEAGQGIDAAVSF